MSGIILIPILDRLLVALYEVHHLCIQVGILSCASRVWGKLVSFLRPVRGLLTTLQFLHLPHSTLETDFPEIVFVIVSRHTQNCFT